MQRQKSLSGASILLSLVAIALSIGSILYHHAKIDLVLLLGISDGCC